jgi:peptidoglycan/xylan/chitin deacetylase (PgdA/CDA1 family)
VDKVRILTYHRVGLPRAGRWEHSTVPPRRFKRQVRTLRFLGSEFRRMDDVADWLGGRPPPGRRPVVLTFDDGYADLHEHLLPLLTERAIRATVFLVPGRTCNDWSRQSAGGLRPLLSWPQIREMADAGVDFGSHGLTHVRLPECGEQQLRAEVADSRKRIEDRLGRAVRHFAYPYGKLNERVVDAVREAGYSTGCTTTKGAVVAGADPFRLPRLTVGKRMGMVRFLLRFTVRH